MSDAFDPYYTWLSIPPQEQPPNHYRLLGVALLESNPEVIESAADRQMAHVRSFQSGKHSAASQKLLNELAAARLCLLSADKKLTYDRLLRSQLAPSASAARPKPPIAAQPPTATPALARATPVQPTRVARSVAAQPKLVAAQPQPVARAAAEVSLGFDPLADGASHSSPPRQRPRNTAAGRSLAIGGVVLVLVIATGLAWAVLGGGNPPSVATDGPARSTKLDGEPASSTEPEVEPVSSTEPQSNNAPSEHRSKIATAGSGQWRFVGEIPWCGEIGPAAGIPDEPSLTAELSPDGLQGRIGGKSGRPEDILTLEGTVCGWFGKALVWETTVKDLARTIKLSYGAPWIDSRVAYRLAIYSVDGPPRQFRSYELRSAVAEIQVVKTEQGELRAGVLLDGDGQPGVFVGNASQPVRVALAAVMRSAGLDGDMRFELLPSPKPHTKIAPSESQPDLFLSQMFPDDVQTIHGSLYWARAIHDGALYTRGLLTHPPNPGIAAHVVYQVPRGYNALQGRAGISEALPPDISGSATAVTFRVVGDGKTLWTSQPLQRRGVVEDFSVPVSGVKTLELFVDCPGDNYSAWTAWFDPYLTTAPAQSRPSAPKPASGQDMFLSQLKAEDVHTFQGTPLFGETIWLDGAVSPHGLLTHPMTGGSAQASFQLPGSFRQFVGRVGVSDLVWSEKPWSQLTFRVMGDGRELWRSRPIQGRGQSEPFDIDIRGVHKLQLAVDCPDSDRHAHAVWFEPKLIAGTRSAGKPQK